jgi:hypothetical protein
MVEIALYIAIEQLPFPLSPAAEKLFETGMGAEGEEGPAVEA